MLDGLNLPSDNRIGPNCGVTCVSLAAGISFQEAWNVLRTIRPRRGNWKGCTTHAERKAALDKLGVKYVEMKLDKNYNLRNFIRKFALNNDMLFMVRTTRHVQMVKHEIISDQRGPTHWEFGSWRLGRKVKNVLIITGNCYYKGVSYEKVSRKALG